jgi:hypothetical protein
MNEKAKFDKLIVYSGNDLSYWKAIQQRFLSNYNHLKFDFEELYDSDPNEYQNTFLNFLEKTPSIIYIDFSANLQSQLQLALMLKRVSTTQNIPMVGLIDDTKHAQKCWTSGVDFIHVKCGEMHDVVYDPFALGFPKEAVKPDFARARLTQQAELYDDIRIGYIAADYIHAEGNLFLRKGEIVEIETQLSKDIIPSNKFIVGEVKTSDLYYDYNYSYDLEMLFVDKPAVDDEEMAAALQIENVTDRELKIKVMKEKVELQMADFDNDLLNSKKAHKDWLLDHIDMSHPKKTKILLIDSLMKVLEKEKKPLDQYHFTIRCQTVLTEDYHELERGRPNIIAMKFAETVNPKDYNDMDPEDAAVAMKEKEQEYEAEAMAKIRMMMDWVKSIKGYNPFVILFNCENFSSKAFQDSLKYPLVITYKGDMVLETILDMAELFEKKQEKNYKDKLREKLASLKKEDPQKYGRLRESDFVEDRYYVRKSNPLSHAYTKHEIMLKAMTESEVHFLVDKELDLVNYRLVEPCEVSVKLIPQDEKPFVKDSGQLLYKGLIHATGEDEKKDIRKFVNEIFFSGINQEREKEKEAFDRVNQEALEAKEAKEEAEKEKAEKALQGNE